MSRKVWIETVLVIAIVAGLYIYLPAGSVGAETAVVIPAAAVDNPKVAGPLQTAVLAGGCFWGVQAVYQHVQGVREVLSGYSGGSKATAEYETVSTGSTGHAESVQIRFDPKEVSYGEILRIYFSVVHNPTELNKQGPDVGTQYRSIIFYADEEQKRIAEAYVNQLERAHVFPGPIVTEVVPLKAFYNAEMYHQNYATSHPDDPYIAINDAPKLDHLRDQLLNLYKK